MNTIKDVPTSGSCSPTAAAIREIRVSRVEFQKPTLKKRKNAGGDVAGWYKVSYSTFITMPNGRPKEIKTHTTKDMQNHSADMMKKTRGAIDSQLEELDVHLDVRLGAGPLYMETDVFWKYLWVSAEHKISELKLADLALVRWIIQTLIMSKT